MHRSLTVVSDFHSVLFLASYSKGVDEKEGEIKLWQMVLSVWLLLSSAGPVVSKVRAVKMALSIKWITKCRLPVCFLQNLDYMCQHCRSFCWFNNFQGEGLRAHYLRNFMERKSQGLKEVGSDLISFSLVSL